MEHKRYMVEYDFPAKHIYFNSKLEAYRKAHELEKGRYAPKVFKLIEYQIEWDDIDRVLQESGFMIIDTI